MVKSDLRVQTHHSAGSRNITRRTALAGTAAALAMPFVWRNGRAQTRPRVAVVGGGAAGATAAHTLARDADGAIDITLIEAKSGHFPAHAVNRTMAGLDTPENATLHYEAFAAEFGITIVHDRAVGIDAEKKRVILESAPVAQFDRLILAPGIRYDLSGVDIGNNETGITEAANWLSEAPHGTIAEDVARLGDGDTFIMVPAPRPCRFPQGAYERVSLLADAISRSGKKARILIIDEFGDVDLHPAFTEAWKTLYPGMIEPVPLSGNGAVTYVSMSSFEVRTANGLEFNGAAGCFIPRQKAGAIADASGLTDDTGWCPVDPATFRSRIDPDIHIIGDAANAGNMPKTASAGASQAETAARAILSDLIARVSGETALRSQSWCLTSLDTAVVEDRVFEVTPDGLERVSSNVSAPEDTAETRTRNARLAEVWHKTFRTRMTGQRPD